MKVLNRIVVGIGWSFAFILGLIVAVVCFCLLVISKKSVGVEDLKIADNNTVGVIELKGEIFSAEGVRQKFENFVSEEKVKAIVLRIDSPGGTLGASEEIFQLIKEANKTKPVVCSLGTIAASGGLYISNACKKVVSHKGTITGSIGVILMTPYLGDIFERFGLKMNIIKSGQFKDAGSPFREMGEEDRGILQGVIDQGHKQFEEVISKSRDIPIEEVKKFSDGRIFLGEKALELGLVDHLGGTKRAAKIGLELAGIEGKEPELVYAREPRGLIALLRRMPNSKIFYYLDSLIHPKVLYRSIY